MSIKARLRSRAINDKLSLSALDKISELEKENAELRAELIVQTGLIDEEKNALREVNRQQSEDILGRDEMLLEMKSKLAEYENAPTTSTPPHSEGS